MDRSKPWIGGSEPPAALAERPVAKKKGPFPLPREGEGTARKSALQDAPWSNGRTLGLRPERSRSEPWRGNQAQRDRQPLARLSAPGSQPRDWPPTL